VLSSLKPLLIKSAQKAFKVANHRQIISEFMGTALLVCTVVGSGIMAQKLSGGNVGLALLCNAIATGAILFVLIELLGPISGAQFNPVVSLWLTLENKQPSAQTVIFSVAQIAGGIIGAILANAMFDLDPVQISTSFRGGAGQWLAEIVATFGLVLTIAGLAKNKPSTISTAVALYITAAYFFTSSTSFANPAVTIARIFSDSFAGISPISVLPFIFSQLVGMVLAWRTGRYLFA
jgi:glycerol uptake facilitator-like aquaporin